MTESAQKERRSHVRGDFFFKVKFEIMTPEEYKSIKEAEKQFLPPDKAMSIDIHDADKIDKEIAPDDYIHDFLLHMDEKLDRILALLSKEEDQKGPLNRGIGLNISGAGICLRVDKPVEPGKIIQARFVLEKSPLVFIKVFGEVENVTTSDEAGKTVYDLGVKFLDLNPYDRERIIASVFQKQREILRNRQAKGDDNGDS